MRFIYLLVFLVFSHVSHAQLITKGKIIDAASGEALAYVNIGVIGKNIGTVSGRDGTFTLAIPQSLKDEKIRVSMVGYSSKDFIVKDFIEQIRGNYLLNLEATNLEIPEITINESALEMKRLGNKTTKSMIQAGFGNDTLGNEVALKVKVRRRKPVYIREFNLGIANNPYDTLKFRLNFYSIKNGKPGKLINQENIIISTSIKEGLLTADLRPYNLKMDRSFYISIEWIEDLGEGDLNFYAYYPARSAYYRHTSHAEWKNVIKAFGIAMNVMVVR